MDDHSSLNPLDFDFCTHCTQGDMKKHFEKEQKLQHKLSSRWQYEKEEERMKESLQNLSSCTVEIIQ